MAARLAGTALPRVLRDSRTENSAAGPETTAVRAKSRLHCLLLFSDSSASETKVAGASHGRLPKNHTSQEALRPRDLGAPRDHSLGCVRNYTAGLLHRGHSLSTGRTTVVSGELCFPEPTAAVYMHCEDNGTRTAKLHFPENYAAAKRLSGHSSARTDVVLPGEGQPC